MKENIAQFIEAQAKKRVALLGIADLKINGDTDLVKEGFFDSLSFVDLIADCEQEFNAEVDLEKYEPGTFTLVKKLAVRIIECHNSRMSSRNIARVFKIARKQPY